MARPRTEAADYKSLLVRMPEEMLEAFKHKTTQKRRSLNAQMLCLIENWLQTEEEKQPHAVTRAGTD